jgi:phosphatidylserine/phosphatidylglycerophosphate/cardiolipin synthase-like enzyme
VSRHRPHDERRDAKPSTDDTPTVRGRVESETVRRWLSHTLVALLVVTLVVAGIGTIPTSASSESSHRFVATGSAQPTATAGSDGVTAASILVPNETAAPDDTARIVAVLPNPRADGDDGEYVRLELPPGNWTLSDGETAVNVTGPGTVVVTGEPSALPNGTEGRVYRADIGLSNSGERLRLTQTATGAVVDVVRYREASTGSRWLPEERAWRPVGYTPRSVAGVGAANVTAFVLPDAPGPPVETLQSAEERILLAGYTLTSERVGDALVAAAERGVRVSVLLDADPVGGITQREADLLSRLQSARIPVRLIAGETARFRFHHPKYAVVDDRAVVLTENWKPAGTGGNGSRGWGVRIDSDRAADELASVFHHDWSGPDARTWTRVRRGRTFESGGAAIDSFPSRFEPEQFRANAVFVLTAPGNAESGVVSVVDTTTDRVDVIQPTVERGRLLDSTKRAAKRGVTVRILLSGAWYVAEDNQKLAESLNEWAERVGVPLTAKLADPGNAFGKIHAKGVIADDTVIVGSLNWNPTSARENREVAVALRGPEVADYYGAVFAADWNGPGQSLLSGLGDLEGASIPPILGMFAVGAVAGVALLFRRRVRFAAENER